MEVTIKISESLAEEARARGLSIQLYVQEILASQGFDGAAGQGAQVIGALIGRILELRKENKFSGLRIEDLIHQDRRFLWPS